MHPRASILRSRWRPGGPSETPRAYFGGLGGDVGARGGLLEAPRRALWSSRGGLGTPRERSREHFGAFWAVFGSYFGVSFSRAVVARIELYFAPSPNLFLRFSRLCKNGGHRSRLVNTNEFATFYLAF